MSVFPISKLYTRFEPIEESSFIFVCNKDGMLPIGGNRSIPIKALYFIINPMNPISFANLKPGSYYRQLFAFDTLIGELPSNPQEVKPFKDAILKYCKENELFARTLSPESTYIDNEMLIEWVPEKTNIIAPIQSLPLDVRADIGVPYPLEQSDDSIVVFPDDNIVHFGNVIGRYNFIQVGKKTLTIRHYYVSEDKNTLLLQYYTEIDFGGTYIARFQLDTDQCIKFGEQTVASGGYTSIGIIINKVYKFNSKKYIDQLKASGKGFTYATYQKQKMEQRKEMGLEKLACMSLDDEDGGGFFQYGDMNEYALQQAFEDSYL